LIVINQMRLDKPMQTLWLKSSLLYFRAKANMKFS